MIVALSCVVLSWVELSWVELSWVEVRWVEVRWVEVRWGEGGREGRREGGGMEGQRDRESERVWCMGAENDHFVNVRSSLDRVLTTQFDWLEVSLAWNCNGYVYADQLSSAIIHHDLIWYDVISSGNLIWTSMCVYVVCALLTTIRYPWI